MKIFLITIGSTILVSLIAFVGILGLLVKEKLLEKILLFLVGFSAGTLLGGAMLHLIPETLEESPGMNIFIFVLCGFSIFFLLERLLHWHHCHRPGAKCDIHTLAYMNLIGDGLHNFIDGLIIAASFTVDLKLGLVTVLAVISHEIPQEISDFGVLLYGGFTKMKALMYNFFSALLAVVGAFLGFFLFSFIENITPFMLAFTAGGFIYIAASDLIPELNKEKNIWKSLGTFFIFLLGIGLMYVIKIIFEG